MKYYKGSTLKKVDDVVNKITSEFSIFPATIEYREKCHIYEMSKIYYKRQNEYLKNEFFDDVIFSFSAKDEESNKVKNYSIRCYKKYSLKQWISLLVGISHYMTKQKLAKFISIN